MLFVTETGIWKCHLHAWTSMADDAAAFFPVSNGSSLKKPQTKTLPKKTLKPHRKQKQNPGNPSVNLILLSFFVEVLIQSICVIMFFSFGMKNISASALEIL